MLTQEEREILNEIISIRMKGEKIFECQYKSITHGNNEDKTLKGVGHDGYIEHVYP